jgi:hypothetical protein
MSIFRVWLIAVLMILAVPVSAQVGSLLHSSYKPSRPRGSVQFYLEDIERRTGVQFSYSDELVKRRRGVRLTGSERTIGDVLNVVLAGTGVTPAERNGKILLVPDEGGAPYEKESVTISGVVKDSASKEVIIGAIVFVPALNIGTTTNTYGFYSLSLPAGSYDVVTASLAYRTDTSRVTLRRNLRRDMLLPYGLSLGGVVVSSQKEEPVDHSHLTSASLAGHAGMLGENDVMRALQQQTGVQSGADGSSAIIVRGGDPGQNLNLLDGVPLYYIDHFYGITSIYNTEAVKSVDFYKGAFPSRYGGRLSSIIDVSSRDGNMERISGQASIGLLKGNLTLESPIVKNKASMMVSARRTWADALWRPFFDEFGMDFYDINAKVNYIINKNNRVYAAFYTGRDQYRIRFDQEDSRALWGNTIGSARWTSIISSKLFINTSFAYSYFRYNVTEPELSSLPDSNGVRPRYTGKSDINDRSLKLQADYYASSKHHVQTGLQYVLADFAPASVSFSKDYTTLSAARFRSNEIVVYAEDELKLSKKWMARAGLHLVTWVSEKYSYSSLQPRLFIAWKPVESQTVHASLTKMSQFLHQLSSNTSLLPSDFWVPSTARIEPELSWLYSAGYSRKISSQIELDAEVYYKNIKHIVSYKNSGNIFENSKQWEDQLTQGRGYGYGAELHATGKWGPLSTSVGYTLSWAWRQFESMNNGSPFPYRYDRRHNLHTEVFYQPSRKFNAVASWTYMSGEAITLPDQLYPDFDNSLLGSGGYNTFTYNFSARNNYRLPAIHRLDLAINFIRQRGIHFERIWTLGLYNAYGRKNIMGVVLTPNDMGSYTLQGLSIFRWIPTLTYAVKF